MNQPLETITCTRRVQFCAGHRVMGHENKCANLHGHNYVAYFTAEAIELDGIGRIIDFSVLKQRLGGWIDREWDHGFILNEKDHGALSCIRDFYFGHTDNETTTAKRQKLYLLPFNPTAENMAIYLLNHVGHEELQGTGVELTSVKLYETENCFATASK